MILLSWNCRGLGSLSAVPDLKYLVRHNNPEFLFISETLVHNNKINVLRYVLGYDSSFSVNSIGHSGGLSLF